MIRVLSPRRVRRWSVIAACGALAAGLLILSAGASRAEPVLTLLIGADADGSQEFARDLSRLWAARNGPTPERLAVAVEPDPQRRLAGLRLGRAEFALLPADEAMQLLPAYPRAKAIAVLWPLYLHALTRNETVQAVRLPAPALLWVLDDARYAHDGFWEWNQNDAAPKDRLELFPSAWAPDALAQLKREILFVSAPAPLPDLAEELRGDPRLRLLPFDPALLEQFRLSFPWLRSASLPLGTYPGVRAGLELPARHMVIVGSVELGSESVAKLLDTVYGARDAASLANPLFRSLRQEVNGSFSPLLPFHPAAAQALGIAPKQP